MSQSKSKNSTTAATTAKALFSAYQAAIVAEQQADAAVSAISPVEQARIPIPEIGPGCRVSTVESLNAKSELHISNAGLTGLREINFRNSMATYREILALLAQAHERWRAANNLNELEDRAGKAYDARKKAFKALASFLTTHPDHIKETARYVAANPAGNESWMLLNILGGKAGKGVGA